LDRVDGVPHDTSTQCFLSLARTRAPRSGVDGRERFGQLLDLGLRLVLPGSAIER
jgi:hypothetical protein